VTLSKQRHTAFFVGIALAMLVAVALGFSRSF
jgi:hypothetical protein